MVILSSRVDILLIALPFLDLLEVPRASVYQSLFECTKMKLEGSPPTSLSS
jgi:hypothetical protein